MRLNCQSAFDVLIARETQTWEEQRASASNDPGLFVQKDDIDIDKKKKYENVQ